MINVKSLISLEFKSIPKGYLFLSEIDSSQQLEFIEIIPQAPGKLVCLLGGESENVGKIWSSLKFVKKDILDSFFVKSCHSSILPALFGQLKPSTSDFVGIVQFKTLSSTLRFVDHLLTDDDCSLLEIDSGRSLGGTSVLYFTFPANRKSGIAKLFKEEKISGTIISLKSPIVAKYFRLETQA